MGPSIRTIVLLSGVAVALTVGITTEDKTEVKRLADFSHAQSRRIQAGPVHLSPNHHVRPLQRRGRPTLPAPPYAVQMEPLVQYSQRDPLYHQRQDLVNLTRDNSIEEKVIRVDHESEGTNLADTYGLSSDALHFDHNYQQNYYREPEPIIEIIIKESNETLPAPPPPPVQPVKPTKEPVHVFYVKYKKNPKGKGEDDIIYEAPIPAITPPTEEIHHDSPPQVSDTSYEAVTLPPLPSTTLRTIIHPDSEVYHGSSLKVTFGETEIKSSDASYGESNSPEPSIALPQKEAQSRDSTPTLNEHSSIRRQGAYQTIPQEVYDRNPPKVSQQGSQPTLQSPAGIFNQNAFQQQNLQHLQFQQPQSQRQKTNFPRQAPNQPPPPFRPQHTGSLINHPQQQHQPQQVYQRPQFQPQLSQVQQRQVPRQQNNLYSTNQSPTQNTQQRPQFRQPPQQFDQRPIQYSQPLNNPPQSQSPPSHIHQQQLAQQQQIKQQQIQQQQAAISQFQNHPINVPNREFNHFNPQHFPTSQPLNTPIPLPSKPIHPKFAEHYQQQINLAQQQRLNFIPSTNQPQQSFLPQQLQGDQQQYQQQYRVPQQVVNIPQKQGHSQPLQPFQQSTPSTQDIDSRKQLAIPGIGNLPSAEVIKSIPQLEEHQLQPQNNQPIQNNQQPTVEQINHFNQQLRNQQLNQLNQQQLNQQQLNQQQINQQINQQLYRQQQAQSQFVNSEIKKHQFSENNNDERTNAQFSQVNQLLNTTPRPEKPTSLNYQPKYNQQYSQVPSTTPVPTEGTTTTTTEDPEKEKQKQQKFKANLAALPDEVPDDIREQLLSSGILGNADISILDYDKVGDIPIENLPPEALENFYGAGSAPVPAVAAPDSVPDEDSVPAESQDVEMKVVRYDPTTKEGQKVEDAYIKEDAVQVDSVILNDSKYNRYLPLKVSGANFPLPDASILSGKKVNSVVVLAPVDYDFVKEAEEEEERAGRSAPVQVQGVRFIAGNVLKHVIKEPTSENFKSWLAKEKTAPSDRQSVVLLVVSSDNNEESDEKPKEIFMYDISSEKLSRLRGELSNTFVEVAENNAQSQEIEGLSDPEGAASALRPVHLPAPPAFKRTTGFTQQNAQDQSEDLAMAASSNDEKITYQAPTISSGYSKMTVQ